MGEFVQLTTLQEECIDVAKKAITWKLEWSSLEWIIDILYIYNKLNNEIKFYIHLHSCWHLLLKTIENGYRNF